MIKNLLFLLATIGLITNISGCTSKKAQDESEIVENAAVDKIDAESDALNTSAVDGAATPTEDASLQAALGEGGTTTAGDPSAMPTLDDPSTATASSGTVALDTTSTAPVDPATTSPDIAAAPTLDESSLNDIPPPADANIAAMPTEDLTSTSEPPAISSEPPAATEAVETKVDTSSSLSSSYSDAPAPKPAGSTLKKVAASVPYQAETGWINTVYVARPGEKLKDISQKIYGSDKTKQLKKIAENSFLKAHSVKAGDKIYYVSPNRPDDSTKMLLYYEDMGMVPETYVAKKGDNLKKVAKEILGYDKAWVELWTSNPVESKTKLAEGESLRYWRSTTSINSSNLAQNTSPSQQQQPTSHAAQLIDQSQMQPGQPTPPPADMNQNVAANMAPPADMNSLPPPPDMPAPPPADQMAAAPPPPPSDMSAPPPPPPDAPPQPAAASGKKKFSPGEEEASATGIEGLDQDTLMSLGAVGFLTVALAFVLIRRRKKRASEMGMTEHNVGS